MLTDNPNVTAFEAITGFDPVYTPYKSHNATPTENSRNVPSEISRADRSLNTRNNCGTNAAVVQNAATNPISSTQCPLNVVIHSSRKSKPPSHNPSLPQWHAILRRSSVAHTAHLRIHQLRQTPWTPRSSAITPRPSQ